MARTIPIVSPYPPVGYLREDSPLRTVARRVREMLPAVYRGQLHNPFAAAEEGIEEEIPFGGAVGKPVAPLADENDLAPRLRPLTPVEGGSVQPLRRGPAVQSGLVPMGRAPDRDGYVSRELAPGVRIQCQKGIEIAAVNVGSASCPIYLVTPGQRSDRQVQTAGGFRSAVGYVGALPLLLPAAKPAAKAIKKVVERRRDREDREDRDDENDVPTSALPSSEDRPDPQALEAAVGALLVDSDGYSSDV